MSSAEAGTPRESLPPERRAGGPPLGRARWVIRDSILPILVTRAALLLVALLALALLPRAPNPGAWDASSQPWINVLSRWDAGWYLSIARDGYRFQAGGESAANTAFFPARPIGVIAGGILIGRRDDGGHLLAGIVIANVALVVALGYLRALVRADFGPAVAGRATLYLLTFPTTFFLSAVYPHSLLLAFSIGALFYARRSRWWLAGTLGAAAALARPYGVLIAAPIAYEYFAHHGFGRTLLRWHLLALALTPLGLLAYLALCAVQFGDALAFVHTPAVANWHKTSFLPWDVIAAYFSGPIGMNTPGHSLLDLTFAAAYLVLLRQSWQIVPTSYALYGALLLLVILFAGPFAASATRYGLDLFPMFVTLGVLGRRPEVHLGYLVFATSLAALFTAMFAQWYWVA